MRKYLILSMIILLSTSCAYKKTGYIIYSYPSGEKMIMVNMLEDRFHGDLIYFNKNGDTLDIQKWINGINESEHFNYDSTLVSFYKEFVYVDIDSVLLMDNNKLNIYNAPQYTLILQATNCKLKRDSATTYIIPKSTKDSVKLSIVMDSGNERTLIKTLSRKVIWE
ncbi:hypothetical protein [Carboxylicivirga linearis]|uniref:Lipoprotein n=1 Tax=Carboxylicivirga linearis TaxID=1628157 RepID=A0ABS5K203_9BACT|nr:hypothetical protein [Carboxylicivirga linearis]MBS2101153.1 hypothetical protein [Carboxylicivirga linearis]